MKTAFILFISLCLNVNLLGQNRTQYFYQKLDTKTKLAFDKQSQTIPVIIWLKDQVPISTLKSIHSGRKNSQDLITFKGLLKEKASTGQRGLVKLLSQKNKNNFAKDVRYFWIRNMVSAKVSASLLQEIAIRNDVEKIWFDGPLYLDSNIQSEKSVVKSDNIEPSLEQINATALWEMGYQGEGTLVMNIDTGVKGDHPALSSSWRGNQPDVLPSAAWFDPHYGVNEPVDIDPRGHGTHTMGTMIGKDREHNDIIGVAPEAQWIAARTIDLGENITETSYTLAAFEWALDPDGDANTTDDIPDVINCSFWDENPDLIECGSEGVSYWEVLDACEAAGIMVFFSAGNKSSKNTNITPPKNRATSRTNIFCVGNMITYDINNTFTIWDGSCVGPSSCVLDDSPLRFKPEVVAPGGNIRSAFNDPELPYVRKTATSMATPHVSGLAALYKQMHPQKSNIEIMEMMLGSTVEVAADLDHYPGEDNTYGMGFIDASHRTITTHFTARNENNALVQGTFTVNEQDLRYTIEVENYQVLSGSNALASFGDHVTNTLQFEINEVEEHEFLHWSGESVQFSDVYDPNAEFEVTAQNARIYANFRRKGTTQMKSALYSASRRIVSTGTPIPYQGLNPATYKLAHIVYEDAGRIYYKWPHTRPRFDVINWPRQNEIFVGFGQNPAIAYSAYRGEFGHTLSQHDVVSIVWVVSNADSYNIIANSVFDGAPQYSGVIAPVQKAVQPVVIKYPYLNSAGFYCILWPEDTSINAALVYYVQNTPEWPPVKINLGIEPKEIAAVPDINGEDIHIVFDSDGDIYYVKMNAEQLQSNSNMTPLNLTSSNNNISQSINPTIAINEDGNFLVGFESEAKLVIGIGPGLRGRIKPVAPPRRVYTRLYANNMWHPFKEFSYNITTNSIHPVAAAEGDAFIMAWKVKNQDKIAFSKNENGEDFDSWSPIYTIDAPGIDYPTLSTGAEKIFMAYTAGTSQP
jgi:subtilisin family serine protease